MVYGETVRGVELQSNNGTIFRCFVGASETITFQIVVGGIRGFESVFEPNDRKELSKLLVLLASWIGIDDAKKILENVEGKKKSKKQ